MNLTITVRHDRDESCNDYTLTRTLEIHEGACNANLIQMSVRGLMEIWKESYPHKGRIPHTPVVDVVLEGSGAVMRPDDDPDIYKKGSHASAAQAAKRGEFTGRPAA